MPMEYWYFRNQNLEFFFRAGFPNHIFLFLGNIYIYHYGLHQVMIESEQIYQIYLILCNTGKTGQIYQYA